MSSNSDTENSCAGVPQRHCLHSSCDINILVELVEKQELEFALGRMACWPKIMYMHANIAALPWAYFQYWTEIECRDFQFHIPLLFSCFVPHWHAEIFQWRNWPNQTKPNLILIFQDNEKVAAFSGGVDHLEQSTFERENVNEKGVFCPFSMYR